MNNFKKYINNNTEIASITYPSEWIAKEHVGMELIFLRPQTSASDTVFRENFNLTISGALGYQSIDVYAEALPDKLKSFVEHFERDKFEIVNTGGYKCAKTIYNYSKGGVQVKVALYQYMLHGQVYSITCTASKDSYEKYAIIFDEVGRSLTVR